MFNGLLLNQLTPQKRYPQLQQRAFTKFMDSISVEYLDGISIKEFQQENPDKMLLKVPNDLIAFCKNKAIKSLKLEGEALAEAKALDVTPLLYITPEETLTGFMHKIELPDNQEPLGAQYYVNAIKMIYGENIRDGIQDFNMNLSIHAIGKTVTREIGEVPRDPLLKLESTIVATIKTKITGQEHAAERKRAHRM